MIILLKVIKNLNEAQLKVEKKKEWNYISFF